MKVAASLLGLAALAQSVSAHYIFNGLIHGGHPVNHAAVRQIHGDHRTSPVVDVNSNDMPNDMRCNVNPSPATTATGDTVGLTVADAAGNTTTIFHPGPAAIYLGKAPGSVNSWHGNGAHWFKIAEWGAEFNPFRFTDYQLSQLPVKIPANTPPGEYLLRAE